MKTSKEDFLRNRALFDQDPIELSTQTNVNLSSKSNTNVKSNVLKQFENGNRSQNKPFFKLIRTKEFYRKVLKEDSPQQEQDSRQARAQSQAILQRSTQTSQDSNESKGSYLMCWLKKVTKHWGVKMSVRVTQTNLLVISTLYLVAILSTVQRQEGSRWLSTLCATKVPGYSTRYQSMSWETFKNCREKQIKPDCDRRTSQTGLTRLGSWISFVDLHKDKACIYVRSPWEKELRKDFVGFFMENTNTNGCRKEKNALSKSRSEKEHISLPWFQIEACHNPSRVIFAAAKKERNDSFFKSSISSDLSVSQTPIDEHSNSVVSKRSAKHSTRTSNDVHARRERSLIGLASPYSPDKSNTGTPVNSSSIHQKISGLEFVLPFKMSQERVYVQNDSIPLKLESPYGEFDSVSSSCDSSSNAVSSQKVEKKQDEYPAVASQITLPAVPFGKNEPEERELFAKNNKLFFGKDLCSLQKGLRNLFYWHGFFPPSDLTRLSDDRLGRPQRKVDISLLDSSKKKEKELFEDTFQWREVLPQREEDRIPISEDFQERVKKGLEEGPSNQEGVHGETLDKNLLMFISQELEKPVYGGAKNSLASDQSVQGVKEGVQSIESFGGGGSSSELHHTALNANLLESVEKLVDELYKQSDVFTTASSSKAVNPFLASTLEHDPFNRRGEISFALKSWPLLANANSLTNPNRVLTDHFEGNSFLPSRLMSGYKFPDCAKSQVDSLFSQYVFEKLLLSCSVDFSHSCLSNQVLLRPLSIKLPPALPFDFYKNFASSLGEGALSPTPLHHTLRLQNKLEDLSEVQAHRKKPNSVSFHLEYRNSSLQEVAEVENVFSKLGRDFQEYLSLPKDSPLAIEISPSLEEDELIRLEAEELRKTETAIEKLHRLQKVQKRESTFEDAKQLRAFAYKNKLAVCSRNVDDNLLTQGATPDENSLLDLTYGSGSVLSDRKQSFFGRKSTLTKRLVAQEEKEINDQILANSFSAPLTRSVSASTQAVKQRGLGTAFAQKHEKVSVSNKQANDISLNTDLLGELIKKGQSELVPYKSLQRAGFKRKIQLLGFPYLSARNKVGAGHRTQRVKQALHGQVIKTPYSHLRWQRKRFRSSLFGTPSDRHLTLPELTSDQWQRMLEWQIKNYLFLEEKRLDPLEKEYVGEQLKVKQLHIYLPWVTTRTASNRPFQWPLTRLDYALSAHPNRGQSDKRALFIGIDKGNEKESLLPLTYQLPEHKPVYYFDSGHSVSLSISPNRSRNISKQVARGKNKDQWLKPFKSQSAQTGGKGQVAYPAASDRWAQAVSSDLKSNTYLCEPFTNHSWLLVYRLLIAFALKDVVRYVFHVTYKNFTDQVAGDISFTPAALLSALISTIKGDPARSIQSIYTPQKRFQDVTIHEKSMLTLNEITWHLRNSCRSRTSPRALLLIGPAKRDKTSLVQAIASEGGGLPLIVQPINDLLSDELNAYRRLESLFRVASHQAPCVVFLDSIDSVGKSRDKVMTSERGQDDCLFALKEFTQDARMYSASVSASIRTNLLTKAGHMESQQYSNWQFNPLAANPLDQPGAEFTVGGQGWAHTIKRIERHEDLQEWSKILRFKRRRLNLLLRLLTIIDGALPLKNGILVVATTEQPASLDPALLRAGRFDRRIHLSSPSQERRIQLFKRETETIGSVRSMPWGYLGTRTTNMSLTDISSAIHYSSIRALLDNTVHTVETLEHGLNFVTGLKHKTVSVVNRPKNDPFYLSRLAFYQAGKAVVHNLLLDHPELGFCSLNEPTTDQNEVASCSDITREHLKVHTAGRVSLRAVSPQMRFCSNRYQSRRALACKASSQSSLAARRRVRSTCLPLNREGVLKTKRESLWKKDFKISSRAQETHTFEKRADQKSLSAYQLDSNLGLQKTQQTVSARTKNQLEIRLIGLYAGKAAELLYLSSNLVSEVGSSRKDVHTAGWLWQSNLGFSELFTASSVIHLMIDRWYLYSQKIVTSKTNRLIPSLNENEMEDEYLFPYVQRFCYHLQVAHIPSTFWDLPDHPTLKGSPLQKNKEKKKESDYPDLNQIYQNRINVCWWNAKICHTIENKKRPFGRWYRMYIPKTEERDDNEEWVPPDVLYHQPLRLFNVARKGLSTPESQAHSNVRTRNLETIRLNPTNKKREFGFLKLSIKGALKSTERVPTFKTLNDLYLLERDTAHQNAAMSSFYQAFDLINENRELLDMFADHLLRFQTVRSYEMAKICSLFSCSLQKNPS